MNISTGIIEAPCRAVFYGPEGIGKSTFATHAPNPVFIDTEGSTKHLDVSRIDGLNLWPHVKEAVANLRKDHLGFRTLVIDTVDWLEKMAVEDLCSRHRKDGIEGFGYGKGQVYIGEMFTELLQLFDALVHSGMHIILLAHAHVRKHEDPGRAGSYDRYTLKLSKHLEPIIKEWADLLCFMNYKTVISDGDKGKVVAGGKERILHTEHSAAFDAKNRYGFKPTLGMEFQSIAEAFQYQPGSNKPAKPTINLNKPAPSSAPEEDPGFLGESPPESLSQIQLDNLQQLWGKCSSLPALNYGKEEMEKLWAWLKTDTPVGQWSKLSKDQAAQAIGFLSKRIGQSQQAA